MADRTCSQARLRQELTALRRRYQELSDFVTNAPIGLHRVGPDGTILWANQAELDLLGYTYDDYVGHPIAAFHADPPVIADILQRLQRGETLHNYEARLRCHDGTLKHMLIDSNVLWEQDTFVHTRCFTRDITARQQAEAEVFAELAQSLSASLDLDTVLQRVVTGAQELCGSERALIMLREPDAEVLVGRYEVGALSMRYASLRIEPGQGLGGQVLLTGRPWRTDNYAADPRFSKESVTESRAAGYLAVLAVPILSGTRVEGVLYVSNPATRPFAERDEAILVRLAAHAAMAIQNAQLYRQVQAELAERQKAEATLAQAAAELEQRVAERTADLQQAHDTLRHEMAERQRMHEALLQREKLAAMSTLLASVAHELNNPLATILLQAELVREDAREGPLAEPAAEIVQAAARCERLVRQFLTLARQHPPERTVVTLNTLVAETVEFLVYPFRVDTVAVHLHLDDQLPPLWGDPHQLQQVLLNLLSNAQDALRAAPGAREITCTTQYHPTQQQITLAIADTGPGMSPALQARIFEPFFTTKPPGVGTGLGLPLCRGIVEAHGGTLEVASALGHGATFQITLPVEAVPAPSPASPSADAEPTGRGQTILVVEDEQSLASGLARLLRRDGHIVDTVANGRLALAQLEARAYDLILCDVRMPELDGPSLYRLLERQQPHLCQRFLFLTGDTLEPATQAFLAQSGVPCLTKPFSITEARRAIRRASYSERPAAPADAPLATRAMDPRH